MYVCVLSAGPFVALTLLGQSPSGGRPPNVTEKLKSSTLVSSTPSWPLTGNPILDREKISGPRGVDVRTKIIYNFADHV